MKKITLLLLFLWFGVNYNYGQITYSQNWETTGLNSWTTSGSGSFSRVTTTPCSGTGSVRANNYYANSSYLVSPVLTGTNGGDLTVNFNYKVTMFSSNTTGQTLTNLGTIVLQWSTSTAGPWTSVFTIDNSNHIVSASCASKSATFSGLPLSGNVYIRFVATSGNGTADNYVYFDDVSISQGAPPSCLPPTGLAINSLTTGSVNLTWTNSVSAPSNNYDIYWSTSATAPNGSTTPSATNQTTPYNLTGLSSATTYYWWVRSNCGGSNSSWASGGSFTTLCSSEVAPTVLQTFDTFNGAAPNPVCWSEATGTLAASTTLSGTTSAWLLKTNGFANITSANKGASINLYSTKNDWIISNPIDLGGTPGIYQLRYKYAVTSYNGTTSQSTLSSHRVDVVISTDGGVTWSNANIIKTYTGAGTYSNTGVNETIPLSSYSGTIKIAFVATTTATSPDIDFHIDDFIVEAIPSCIPPTSLFSNAVTSSGATFNWTASTSAPSNGYDIYWSTVNTAPNAGTTPTIDNHPSTTYNATSLTSNTTYYWWVRSDCGGDLSTWASGGSFTTSCTAVTIPTPLETFEGASTGIPVCWSRSLVSGSTNWNIISGGSGDISGPYAGTNFMEKDYNTSDAVLVSMPIDYSSVSAATRINAFLHRHASAHANDQYKIYVNTAPTLTGATQVFSLYSRTTIAPTVASTGWYNYTIDIPGSFNGQSQVFIIFEGITTAGFSSYDLGIDNFIVEYLPSCLPPSTLVASNVGVTTADFSWTASTSAPSNGYDIYWSTVNTAPNGGTTPTIDNNAGTTYNATGLTTNTTYYWWVRSDCGGSDYSTWSSGGSFTTQLAVSAPYTEGFATTATPSGWNTTGWNIGTARGATGNPGNNLYKNFWSSATTGNYTLINVTNITSGMYLTFDYQFTNYSSPYGAPAANAGNFNVEISTNYGSTYSSIGVINLDGTPGWKTFIYDLAPYLGQTIKVRVSGVWVSGDWDAAFDNFAINVPYCLLTTTWNGATWSNGVPTANRKAIINGNYSGAGFDACTLDIQGSSIVNITSGTLNIDGAITTGGSASLELQNGVYVLQTQNVANTGNTIVNRNSSPMIRLDYTAWSSPVANQNLLAFSPNTVANRFYTYNPAGVDTATSWIPVASPSTTSFSSGVGYLIRVANTWSPSVYSPYLGRFTGVLNNGNYLSAVGIGYNLLGNPYPSPFDADTFLANNAGIGATTMYFWTHTIASSGGTYAQNNYASYTTAGGVAAAAGGAQPDGTIQVGQGFFINATSAGNAQFNNAQRVGTSSGQFFKNNSIERHRYWLNLSSGSNPSNQMMVAYMTGATNGIDTGIDGKLFTNSLSSIASLVNNESYVIQGRSLSFDVNDEVPLVFTANTNGNFTISLEQFDGLFSNQDIFIWDKEQNVIHDLKASAYSFTALAGVNTTRFSVVYSTSALGANDFELNANLNVYTANNNIMINAGQNIIKEVNIFDIQGRRLVSKNKLNVTETEIENTWGTNQVLIVEVFTEQGRTVKKIIL